jgi:hypothetical protein
MSPSIRSSSDATSCKALLKDACAVGRRRPDLADATIAAHRRRLERQLERLLARKPITHPLARIFLLLSLFMNTAFARFSDVL